MNRRFALFTSTLIILFLLTPLYKATVEVALGSPATTIFVNPPTSTVSVGQTFFIDIKISDVSDLYGWEFKLKWNSTLLDALTVTEGPFLKQGGDTFFWQKINNTAGYILVDCTLLGSVPGVSGNGTLATVEFYAEVQGESILDLYETTLISSNEQSIPHESTDGYGYFTPPHDVAVISIIASPTTVLPGQAIHINVTVQNQGDYAETFNVTTYYNSHAIETQLVSLDIGASTNLTFTWNTTGINKGDYMISAEASVVSDETDTTDNTKVYGTVTVIISGHDIAVKGVAPSKTVVGQGYSLYINVTAKNYGSFTETFNITVYHNEINSIATQNFITLTSGNSTTITFTWNTAGVPYGNYTINANASIVPDETYTDDNTYTDGWVVVTILGDVDGNGKVDWQDLSELGLAYGSDPLKPNWNPEADFNASGKVDWEDLSELGLNYGESCS